MRAGLIPGNEDEQRRLQDDLNIRLLLLCLLELELMAELRRQVVRKSSPLSLFGMMLEVELQQPYWSLWLQFAHLMTPYSTLHALSRY